MSKLVTGVLAMAAALALAGCASDFESKYEEQQKTNLDLASENEILKQHRAEEAAKVEALAQQLKQSDAEAQKARQTAEANAKEAEALRQQAANGVGMKPESAAPSASGTGLDEKSLQAIVAELKKELGKQAPEVTLTKDGNIEIMLAADVTFGSGSADLSEAGKKSLKSLTPLLKGRFAPYQVRVEGHTDSTPLHRTAEKYKDNFGLGSARSLAVVRYMESELAIEPTRLMSASRGEHAPVAEEKTDAGKKKNRRVEIVVVIPHDAAMSLAK